MYVVPSVKKSPTKQNPSHFRDPYNGLYDIINPKLTYGHLSYWEFWGFPSPLPLPPQPSIPSNRTFKGPAPEMKVFKADLWEGIFWTSTLENFHQNVHPVGQEKFFSIHLHFWASKRLRFPECFKHNSWNVQHPQRGNPKIGKLIFRGNCLVLGMASDESPH